MQTEKGAGALHAEEKERAKEAREDGGPRPGGKRPLQAGRRGRVAWEGEEKTLRQTEVSPGGGQWGMMASVADYAKEDWACGLGSGVPREEKWPRDGPREKAGLLPPLGSEVSRPQAAPWWLLPKIPMLIDQIADFTKYTDLPKLVFFHYFESFYKFTFEWFSWLLKVFVNGLHCCILRYIQFFGI